MHILTQGAPEHMDIAQVRAAIEEISGVDSVHHIHIWRLDENRVNFEDQD